jgi:transposase
MSLPEICQRGGLRLAGNHEHRPRPPAIRRIRVPAQQNPQLPPFFSSLLRRSLRSVASGAVEVITGRERRRRWSIEEKLRIVAETQAAGARITDVAARHGVYPSLLFNWRRQVRDGILSAPLPATFVPVNMVSAGADGPVAATVPPEPTAGNRGASAAAAPRVPGWIEITLPNGCQLRVDHRVDARALRRIVGALRG